MQVIMDTGPWVALIDRSETRHDECVTWLKRYRGDMLSTRPCLTEVLYLLDFSRLCPIRCSWDFVLTGMVTLVPSSIESLALAKRLMTKYHDLPMDFADATAGNYCSRSGRSPDIVTFDTGHFSIYRVQKEKGLSHSPLTGFGSRDWFWGYTHSTLARIILIISSPPCAKL